jgi:hypothetical protein
MNLLRSCRTRCPGSFQPRLEALEDRQLLSVTTTSLSGGAWVLSGDAASDRVVINDNGTGGVNNITVTVNGIPLSPNASVWKVTLNMNGGDDTVKYNLMQPLQPGGWYHELHVDLGRGNDTFDGFVRGVSSGAAGLNLYVDGRDGNDAVRAHVFGTVSSAQSNGGVGLGLTGGLGSDTIAFDQQTPDPQLNPSGVGRDLNISGGALVWANVHGLEGWTDTLNNFDSGNTISLSYRGQLNGALAFQLMGAGGADRISAVLNLASTSTGIVGNPNDPTRTSARILAGAGDDLLTYSIFPNGAAVRLQSPQVDGGLGFDTASVSPGIAVFNVP